MISKKMEGFVKNSSAIRAMFEEGQKMAAVYGKENVYDFSLGNPNVPAPDAVNESMIDILRTESPVMVHGYMNNAGYEDVRSAIAESLNKRFGMNYDAECLIMTVGAAGGMNIVLKSLLNPGDEAITFTPYFGEYRSYVGNYDGVLVESPVDGVTFQPDLDALAENVTDRTRVVIINSPNNPTGVVYTEESIRGVAEVMEAKQKEFGHEIYIFADEPYRELVYGDVTVPYIPKYYRNTIVGYSYSKSLSLPGERIGYVALSRDVDDFENVYAAAKTANRILGFVNAPSLQQRAIARCLDEKTDVAYYDRNRKTLYDALTADGFTCVRPDGAFYLWMKSPEPDEKAFCSKAKEKRILVVGGSSFGCPGFVRIAYCVSYETICGSLPGFAELAEEYGLR
ncbi:MAG: pyridoxal phosphate-dependent aminotransferase [Lachnospiraceae bacterium]|nr:pyridoxal phosphate-dependent aminotransferase [Lachnospiraceae bacterium]